MNRSKRTGLLTENEYQYLGKLSSNPKFKSYFLKSLLPRLEACTNDLNRIWEQSKKDPSLKKWCSDHWNRLYSLGQSIHPRNYQELIPYNSGLVKFNWENKATRTGTRLYWFDENDRKYIYEESQSFPDHQLRGIRPKGVRDTIKEALEVENRFQHCKTSIDPDKFKEIIIPRNEDSAITIKEIRNRTKLLRKKQEGT